MGGREAIRTGAWQGIETAMATNSKYYVSVRPDTLTSHTSSTLPKTKSYGLEPWDQLRTVPHQISPEKDRPAQFRQCLGPASDVSLWPLSNREPGENRRAER
jgi:hypothetical protein